MSAITPAHMVALRRLALNDESFLADVLAQYSVIAGRRPGGLSASALGNKTRRLVDVAAIIAVGSGRSGIDAAVNAAFAAGASSEEIVDVLLSIAPSVGSARVVSAAPYVASAIGYDLEADLEGVRLEVTPGDRIFEG